MKMSFLAAGAAVLLTSACVDIGANYDPAVVDRLQPGMDQAQVIALLGRPTTRNRLSNGTSQLGWSYSHGDALGRGRSRLLILAFDADHKYVGVVSQIESELRMH